MGNTFGDFLRRLRKQKKSTQRDRAREVGVDFSYLSKVENDVPGFSSPSDPDEMMARAGKVPSDVQRILIEDFSLIKEIRQRRADGSTEGETKDDADEKD